MVQLWHLSFDLLIYRRPIHPHYLRWTKIIYNLLYSIKSDLNTTTNFIPGWPYNSFNLFLISWLDISRFKSSNVSGTDKLQNLRYSVYPGKPWSLERWIFIAAKSKETAWAAVNNSSISWSFKFSFGRLRLAGAVKNPLISGSTPPSSTRRHGAKNALPSGKFPWNREPIKNQEWIRTST